MMEAPLARRRLVLALALIIPALTAALQARAEPPLPLVGVLSSYSPVTGPNMPHVLAFQQSLRELGWTPTLQFEEGLEKTVDWYLANQEWLKQVTSGNYMNYYEEQYTHR